MLLRQGTMGPTPPESIGFVSFFEDVGIYGDKIDIRRKSWRYTLTHSDICWITTNDSPDRRISSGDTLYVKDRMFLMEWTTVLGWKFYVEIYWRKAA